MAVTVRQLGKNTTPDNLVAQITSVLQDLEDQLNQRAQIYVSTDGRVPTNLNRNDILVVAYKGNIGIQIKGAKSYLALTASMLGGLTTHGCNFLGILSGTTLPTLANFPNPGDFGFFNKTSSVVHRYLCVNINSVLYKVELT